MGPGACSAQAPERGRRAAGICSAGVARAAAAALPAAALRPHRSPVGQARPLSPAGAPGSPAQPSTGTRRSRFQAGLSPALGSQLCPRAPPVHVSSTGPLGPACGVLELWRARARPLRWATARTRKYPGVKRYWLEHGGALTGLRGPVELF